jgi:hypothetical protein
VLLIPSHIRLLWSSYLCLLLPSHLRLLQLSVRTPSWPSQPTLDNLCLLLLGIGIEEINAGIGIPASRILVRYQTQKIPDCVGLVRYWTCSGIVSFFHSGTGLTRCRTVRHSGIYIYAYIYICVHTYTYTHTYTSAVHILYLYISLYIWIYLQICSMDN